MLTECWNSDRDLQRSQTEQVSDGRVQDLDLRKVNHSPAFRKVIGRPKLSGLCGQVEIGMGQTRQMGHRQQALFRQRQVVDPDPPSVRRLQEDRVDGELPAVASE